ncbi:hypothetical protein BURMUCGD1_5776 [Burkholderia multivorans CGD1]|nr:hypothetical protein BURMUCGD1_5776 [Burkholderia multivorans CGD1]
MPTEIEFTTMAWWAGGGPSNVGFLNVSSAVRCWSNHFSTEKGRALSRERLMALPVGL